MKKKRQKQAASKMNFLESDNYEQEFGSSEIQTEEEFNDIMRHEIVEVIGEGDLIGRPFVMIYAYRLPPSKEFDHQKFFRFLQRTLDKVVDMDYTIIYFHYGLKSHNKPSIKWLIQAYQALDRRYKKNLKALYLVHPTKFIKILWGIFKPFISYKFERKMHYCNIVDDLSQVVRIDHLNIPRPIYEYDINLKARPVQKIGQKSTLLPTHQFGVPLSFILDHHPGAEIPPIVNDIISFLRHYGMETEGIFRRSAELSAINKLQERINSGERIDFVTDPEYRENLPKAVIHSSVLFKTFLRSMGEPVITNQLYPSILEISNGNEASRVPRIREVLKSLPHENYVLLKTVVKFLTEISLNHEKNLMNPSNLSIVFGPNLTWPTDQQVPLSQINRLNSFCLTLIEHCDDIFDS